MAVEIKVPAVGESIVEGVLSQWLKSDGSFVEIDEPIFELETEKATQPIPAPATGILHITVREGETIAIGSVVGTIEPKEADQAKKSPPQTKPKPSGEAPQGKQPASRLQEAPQTPTPQEAREAPAKLAPTPVLAPSVRALVEEYGLDARKIPGTGRNGRITKEDVLRYLQQQQTAIAPKPDGKLPTEKPEAPPVSTVVARGERRERMSAIRQRIAERLVQSQQTTATLTTFNEADMSAVMELRKRFKDRFKEKHDVHLGFMSFFVKACVDALRTVPLLNARIDNGDIVYNDFCNIGVAVSTEKGLMVPVIHQAETLSFAEIERRIADLAAKSRDGRITIDDLRGGTFTITNGGVFGSLLSTPILNPPQSAILGMHTIQRRPVVVDEQIVIRPMMYLALSYDHRLIDGREAVLFLVRVKECIENPERMLLEV